jgi:hypothetical protein
MPISSQIGSSSLIKPGVVDSAATRPASPFEGQVIFQKDTDQLLVWNSTAWVIPNSPAQNPQGLELVTTATCTSGGTASGGVITIGSTQSNVVVATAFSSTYDNYKIVATGFACSVLGNAMYIKLNNSTGSTYYGNMIYNVPATSAIGGVSAANGASNGFFACTGSTTGTMTFEANIDSPFLAVTSNCVGNFSGRSYNGQFSTHDSNAASSTGFTFAPSSGTITGGTIRVYGFRNS